MTDMSIGDAGAESGDEPQPSRGIRLRTLAAVAAVVVAGVTAPTWFPDLKERLLPPAPPQNLVVGPSPDVRVTNSNDVSQLRARIAELDLLPIVQRLKRQRDVC